MRSSTTPYHWPRDLATSLLISLVVILAGGLITLIFYRLTSFEILFIGSSALLTALTYTSASMLNSNSTTFGPRCYCNSRTRY